MFDNDMNLFDLFDESADNAALQETLNEATKVVHVDKASIKKKLLNQATLLAAKGTPEYAKYRKHAKAMLHQRAIIRKKYASQGKKKLAAFLKAQKELKRK